jgi:KDO2-lipid IV(A) lauroyltransferase
MWLSMLGIARLPFAWQVSIVRGVGRALRHVKRREARTAATNLALCFPQLDARARRALLERHFEAVGMSFVETAIGWTWPLERLERHVEIKGREHLAAALAAGRGVLLVSAHFTPLEVGVAMLEALCERCNYMYRPQRNAMLDALVVRGRARFAYDRIPRDNVRTLLRKLKSGEVVAYMPDQTYLGKQSAILPFFGEPAVANVATSKLASLSGAVVLTYFFRRLPGAAGYVVDIEPLEGFPSENPLSDARRLLSRLERYIEHAPEQYLWIYKKFKARPPPYPDPYLR